MQRYTIGLLAKHYTFKRPTEVKVFMRSEPEGVRMTVESARNMSTLRQFGSILITHEEYEERPRSDYNNTVEALWAFDKFGLSI